MASDVKICNMALSRIGEDPIIDLNEDSKAGRACKLIYADTRDSVLREHPWNFAIKRVELARLTTDPIFEFDAAFGLPSDCLRVLRTDDDLVAYRVEGMSLLSNNSIVMIEYIAKIEDPTQFDSMFVDSLADRIGSDLAFNLSDNNGLSQVMFQRSVQKIKQARSMDGQEGIPRSIEADQWLNSRL